MAGTQEAYWEAEICDNGHSAVFLFLERRDAANRE
jgi:hypothetical protein